MKSISPALLQPFREALRRDKVPVGQFCECEKWLRFYLDFCLKYKYPPRDKDSLAPFLQKLAAKNQTGISQKSAAQSISVYYEIVKTCVIRDPASHAGSNPIGDAWDAVYMDLKNAIQIRQYSPKTLKTYRIWTEQFEKFLGSQAPASITADDAARFLTHLATERKVVASTQNQAFNALLFLFRHILKADFDLKDKVARARRTRYIPSVLTREEVDRVVAHLNYPFSLITQVLYGCGLRLFEALNLRVGCLDFDERIVTVHDGKGKKDRTIPMPEVLIPALKNHIQRVSNLHEMDLKANYAGVFMPGALDRKWPNAAKEWVWQWVFPARTLTYVPDSQEHRRYHLHESVFQKSLRSAVGQARVPKRVTAHTFRHSFASHLLLANYDIRTIQEMLGHSDVRTTMIYTHTVKSRTRKERQSPLDFTSEKAD